MKTLTLEEYKEMVSKQRFTSAEYYSLATPKGKMIFDNLMAFTALYDYQALSIAKEFTKFSYKDIKNAFDALEKYTDELELNCNTRWYVCLKYHLTKQKKWEKRFLQLRFTRM